MSKSKNEDLPVVVETEVVEHRELSKKKECTCVVREIGSGMILKGDPDCPVHGQMILKKQNDEAVKLLKEANGK